MSERLVAEHWSAELEEYLAATIAKRDDAQSEADESLADSDLFGASMGLFKYALASLELGDKRDFHSAVIVGTYLAQREIVLEAEKAQLDPLDCDIPKKSVDFKIPLYVSFISKWEQDQLDAADQSEEGSHDAAIREQILKKQVMIDAVAHAEALLEVPHVIDAEERNRALSDAITAVSDIMFARHPQHNQHGFREEDSQFNLLKLAKRIADKIEVGYSKEGDIEAFNAYYKLMLASLYTEGAILGPLNQAMDAFEKINGGSAEILLTVACRDSMRIASEARRYIIARTMVIAALQMRDSLHPGGDFPEYMRQRRAPKYMQELAKETYSKYRELPQVLPQDDIEAQIDGIHLLNSRFRSVKRAHYSSSQFLPIGDLAP